MTGKSGPEEILQLLSGKWADGTRPKDLYNMVISRCPEEYVGVIMEGLGSLKRKVQSGCAELASLLSEDRPELLYPQIDIFIQNLSASAPVLRWEAVCTLGNLARVDEQMMIPPILERITSHLGDESVVLQGHAVRALGKIAEAYPELAEGILDDLLNSKGEFPGNRLGFIIDAMETFASRDDLAARVRDFVEPYTSSDIPVVARKARRVMRILG